MRIPDQWTIAEVSIAVLAFAFVILCLLLRIKKNDFRLKGIVLIGGVIGLCVSVWCVLRWRWISLTPAQIMAGKTAQTFPVHSLILNGPKNIEFSAVLLSFSALNDSFHVLQFIAALLFTVVLESLVLFLCLTPDIQPRQRLIAGLSLSLITFPFVNILFPMLLSPFENKIVFYVIAEMFACLTECLLFWFFFNRSKTKDKQFFSNIIAIVFANFFSFSLYELFKLFCSI